MDTSDDDESKQEHSATSAEETESESSSGLEVELDPAARLLDQEVRSGRLPRTHLFYRLILNSLKFATEIGDATNQFHHDPVVQSFCQTIKRSGHARTFNLLTGKRMLNRGRGSAHDFCWEDNNIPLPLPSSRKEGYVYQSGLIRAYLVGFLKIAFSPGSQVSSLIDSEVLKVIPISLAKDGFTLKPGFEVDQRAMVVVGGQELYTLEYVRENQEVPHEHFANKFVTEVEIMGITTLDNKTALIVGNDFTGTEGDGRSTLQCHVRRLRELQQCLNCLQKGEDLIVQEECHTAEGDTSAFLTKSSVNPVKVLVSLTGVLLLDDVIDVWKKNSHVIGLFALTSQPTASQS